MTPQRRDLGEQAREGDGYPGHCGAPLQRCSTRHGSGHAGWHKAPVGEVERAAHRNRAPRVARPVRRQGVEEGVMKLKVEVHSSGVQQGSVWENRDGRPEPLVSVLVRQEQALRPRDGVAVIIRVSQ
jgi:hypothetical protein